jgi:hypothetical protein
LEVKHVKPEVVYWELYGRSKDNSLYAIVVMRGDYDVLYIYSFTEDKVILNEQRPIRPLRLHLKEAYEVIDKHPSPLELLKLAKKLREVW